MKHFFFVLAGVAGLQLSAHAQNTFPANGNVGIGTTGPQGELHIRSTARFPRCFIQSTASNGAAGYSIMEPGGTEAWCWNYDAANQLVGFFRPSLGNAVVFTNSGNMGIGTTTPQAKLAVNGTIVSKKVRVSQTGWPDYVFDSTYRLRPLKDVEQYIQQHKHLPEVTPATEIEKEGLDLGDNQATLLKKIEELTLYIIEQNKRLEEQNKRIEALEKKLAGKQ